MKRRTQLTAFYLETLIMIVIMIGILLVLTQVLGSSRRQSAQAKRVTEAVTIAQSVAEAAARTEDLSEVQKTLELDSFKAEGNVGENQTCEGLWRWEHKTVDQEENVQVSYLETDYRVSVTRTWQDDMVNDHIEISTPADNQQIYSLDVQNHFGEKENS